jgi:hypothetical protein
MSASQELIELLHRVAEERADAEDYARLSELLRSHPELLDEYIEWSATSAALCWEYRERPASNPNVSYPTDSATAPKVAIQKRRGFGRIARWAAGLAAVVCMAVLIGKSQTTALANAGSIVRASMRAHREALERVYLVEVAWENPETAARIPNREVHVTTWGDQFWIDIRGRRRIALGSESDGGVWIALSRFRGLRVEPDEIGPLLEDITELFGLRVESMLAGLLRDHELEITDEKDGKYVITATPTRLRGWVREVQIEVDRETKAVRKMVARRRSPHRGFSTVTFTLIETRSPDPTRYQLEGHLFVISFVLTSESQPDRRREVLTNMLGPATQGWMIKQGKREE